MNLHLLSEPFAKQQVHWRAQQLTKSGDKALALAYIDARDVMDRLDAVCTPSCWSSEFEETAKGRVFCRLSILVGDKWVTKSDGAGETAVEGEKGGISDALKRAAVSWGIGRYLYRLGSPWVPCKTWQDKSGKVRWSDWSESPWDHVKNAPKSPDELAKEVFTRLKDASDKDAAWEAEKKALSKIEVLSPRAFQHIQENYKEAA